MWEQIRSNKRKSAVLVAAMAVLLLALGYVIGETAGRGGGLFGLAVAFILWLVLSLVAYWQGGRILLAVSGAKKIEKEDHPELHNVVEEMKIASGLSRMPDIYIIDDMSMNAFATGRDPEHAAVAVTAGLLANLNRDELQGVIGHEVAHVVNRDVLLMGMVGVMLGAIVMISEVFLRSLWYGGGRSRRYSSKKGGGQGQAIILVVAIVFAIFAPVIAQVIYFAISRRREYLADSHSAVLTRYPEGLASALDKLRSGPAVKRASKATAAMYIVNPFKKAKLGALTRTHPPIAERIRILRSIGGSVSYAAYQAAWSKTSGDNAGHLPKSALASDKSTEVRQADPRAKKDPRDQLRQAGDALRKVNEFIFLTCVCGLKFKVPPDFKRENISCPKCNRSVAIPVAQIAAVTAVADKLTTPDDAGNRPVPFGVPKRSKEVADRKTDPLQIKRSDDGWMSFRCACGATKTLSPGFTARKLKCGSCGRIIEVGQ